MVQDDLVVVHQEDIKIASSRPAREVWVHSLRFLSLVSHIVPAVLYVYDPDRLQNEPQIREHDYTTMARLVEVVVEEEAAVVTAGTPTRSQSQALPVDRMAFR